MSSYNRVILMGNLTRDPELRYIPAGTAVCEFGLAVNRTWKDKQGNSKDEVSFLDCTAWARTAEVISEHMKKGRPILIEGYLKQETWQDRNGGGNRSKVKIIVDRFSFVGGRSDAAGGPPPAAEEPPAAASAAEAAGAADDDIPF